MPQQFGCASLVKIHPFLQEIQCRQTIFQQSKPLKMGQGHQNLTSTFPCLNNIAVQFRSKSIQSFRR